MGLIPILLAGWVASLACAQAGPDTDVDEGRVRAQLGQLGEEFKALGDWQQQADLFRQTLDAIWERNGWNAEADRFAHGVVTELVQIPPWQFDQRVEKMVERFGDRYELSEHGRARFRSALYREVLGGVWNHGAVLFKQTRQMVGQMARNEPFTSEQIAEWTRQSEPMVQDMRRRGDRFLHELGETLEGPARERFERDVESYTRRLTYLSQQREAWARGEWKPEDWGLQDLPAYRDWKPPAPPTGVAAPPRQEMARQMEARAEPHDPATWHWYVGAFVERYQLDRGQRTAAESILAELVERANAYLQTRADRISQVPPQDRAVAPAFGPVRAMFDELRARVERIPTCSQKGVASTQPIVEQ